MFRNGTSTGPDYMYRDSKVLMKSTVRRRMSCFSHTAVSIGDRLEGGSSSRLRGSLRSTAP